MRVKSSAQGVIRRIFKSRSRPDANARFALDRPADRLITGRVELISGWIESEDPECQMEAICGEKTILLRNSVRPFPEISSPFQGFYGYLFLQEHLSEVEGGSLKIRLYLNGRLVGTVPLRVSCLAQELALQFPLNRRIYCVFNRAARPFESGPPHTLVFPGLGAVGGTSINELFRQLMYRKGWQFPVYFEANDPEFWHKCDRSLYSDVRWVDGHYCYDAARRLGRTISRITFLREPLSRMISVYNYNSLVHPFEFPFSTFDDFVSSDQVEYYSQARGLLRCAGRDQENLSDTELYERSREELRNGYEFVGLTDHFEASIFLVCELAGYEEIGMWWPVLSSPKGVSRSQLRASTLRRLRDKLAVDLRLYEEQRLNLSKLLNRVDFGRELHEYAAEASGRSPLPESYKFAECLRWRQILADEELSVLRRP